MDQGVIEVSIQNATFIFVSIGISVVTILIGLSCIWRVEHQLDTYLKALTAGIALQVAQKTIFILGLAESSSWSLAIQWLDVAVAVVFLVAMWDMYHIIRQLNKENKSR